MTPHRNATAHAGRRIAVGSLGTVARRRRRGPLGRAATLLEFTMVIPIFIFMMLFSVDMGMLMLTSGAVNDAAFSAARAGAQAGGGGYDPSSQGFVCGNGPCAGSVSSEAAFDSAMQAPLSEEIWTYDEDGFRIVSGAECRNGGEDAYVTVTLPYRVNMFTPGLAAMLGMVNEGSAGDEFKLVATGVARCEIYRVG